MTVNTVFWEMFTGKKHLGIVEIQEKSIRTELSF